MDHDSVDNNFLFILVGYQVQGHITNESGVYPYLLLTLTKILMSEFRASPKNLVLRINVISGQILTD